MVGVPLESKPSVFPAHAGLIALNARRGGIKFKMVGVLGD